MMHVAPEDLLHDVFDYDRQEEFRYVLDPFVVNKTRHDMKKSTLKNVAQFFQQNIKSVADKRAENLGFVAYGKLSAIEGLVVRDGKKSRAHMMVKGCVSKNEQELLMVESDIYDVGSDPVFSISKYGSLLYGREDFMGTRVRFEKNAPLVEWRMLDHLHRLNVGMQTRQAHLVYYAR